MAFATRKSHPFTCIWQFFYKAYTVSLNQCFRPSKPMLSPF